MVTLLRQMVEDALPDVGSGFPSASGSPRLALPAPPPKVRPRMAATERLIGPHGLSPRVPPKPPKPRHAAALMSTGQLLRCPGGRR